MSMLSGNNHNCNTHAPFFHEFKKQASFFFREKIKTARLALTDVTPAELLTEEATDGNPWAPDARTLKMISKAAFEVDDYWRIVEILHKRLGMFDSNNWRVSYKSLIVLEHLLTHGPESAAEEFQRDKDIIKEMESFQHIDEKGFNWGLNVRKNSERILKLLQKGPLFREERDQARKLTRGIEGFGSFCQKTSSTQRILQDSSSGTDEICNSRFIDSENQEHQFSILKDESLTKTRLVGSQQGSASLGFCKKMECWNSRNGFDDGGMVEKFSARTSFKENMVPRKKKAMTGDSLKLDHTVESRPLLDDRKDDGRIGISRKDHPFSDIEHQSSVLLLSDVGHSTEKKVED